MNVFRIFLVNCLFISSVACVAEPQKESFNVEKAAGYNPVLPALKSYLVAQDAKKGQQHLCVMGYVEPISGGTGKNKIAWVYWQEGNRLTLWEPAAEGFEPKDTLNHSRRDLDIVKDVTATTGKVGSSTYKESIAWVEDVKKDCQKRGKSYQIIIN
ncbi:MAG: hypothetical protein V4660_10195 [Pseudomonadota bacterium]